MELFFLISAVIAVLAIGLLVFFKNKTNATNIFLLCFSIASAALNLINYFSLRQSTEEATLNLVRWVMFFAILHTSFIFFTVHTFPEKKLRLSKKVSIPLTIFILIVLALTRTNLIVSSMSGTGKYAKLAPGVLIPLLALTLGGLITAAIYTLVKRYIGYKGIQKKQYGALMIGAITSITLSFTTNFLLVNLFQNTSFLPYSSIFTLLFSIPVAYAILAFQLFDIRIIIRRTIIYSSILLFSLATYSLLVIGTTQLIGGAPLNSKIFISNVLGIFIIGHYFEKLKLTIKKKVEKNFYKKDYAQKTTIKDLNVKLQTLVNLDNAIELIMHTAVKTFSLRHAATIILQPNTNEKVSIHKIRYIGYSSNKNLQFTEDDFLIKYFLQNPDFCVVRHLEDIFEKETAILEGSSLRYFRSLSREEKAQLIRKHAVKSSVLSKLNKLSIEVVIPLHANGQLLGLMLVGGKKQSEDSVHLNEVELDLLGSIGQQALSAIQKSQLYELDQSQNQFVSIASHELLTPLSAIEGYLSLILEEHQGKVDHTAHGYLDKVYASAKRLSLLIEDLLSVSRIESGDIKIEPQSLNLANLISDAVEQLTPIAEQKNLKVTFNYDPKKPLPPVWADQDRSMQVVVNLLGNAIKYTPEGEVIITLINDPDFNGSRVNIKDTGIGLSDDQQAHLFQKFYRASSEATRNISGTGLGLYITKSIVEKMNGKIGVESEVGKGSTFYFSLPYFKVEMSKI